MELFYTEENIERIERYLSGEMSLEERTTFEQQMQADTNLKQLVEQQRLLQEGIQWASYQQEKEKLREIHQAILEEDQEREAAKPKVIRFNFRRLSSIAAVLLIGILLGLSPFLFQQLNKQPIVQNNPDSSENNYGGVAKGLPLLETTVSLLKVSNNLAEWQKQVKSIPISIFEGQNSGIYYKWQNGLLQIFIKDIPELEDWDNTSVVVILEQLQEPKINITLLKINDYIYPIPLTNEDFAAIFSL